MSEPVIRFRDVSKVFQRANGRGDLLAVEKLSFEVAPGEIVAVLGKTGCGKSTMFNLVAGLIEPTSGEVAVSGHDPFRDFEFFRGKVGIVFQSDRLMPWRTALANVLLGLEILDAERKQAEAVARGWLERLGLAGHENDYPHALSGGMRQRVSIARAFAVEPELLLCDEPFSSLDEMTARDLRAEFVRLVRQNGKTAVFITHQIREAMEIGDRVLVFHRPARIAFEARMDRRRRGRAQENPRQDPRGARARRAGERVICSSKLPRAGDHTRRCDRARRRAGAHPRCQACDARHHAKCRTRARAARWPRCTGRAARARRSHRLADALASARGPYRARQWPECGRTRLMTLPYPIAPSTSQP